MAYVSESPEHALMAVGETAHAMLAAHALMASVLKSPEHALMAARQLQRRCALECLLQLVVIVDLWEPQASPTA